MCALGRKWCSACSRSDSPPDEDTAHRKIQSRHANPSDEGFHTAWLYCKRGLEGEQSGDHYDAMTARKYPLCQSLSLPLTTACELSKLVRISTAASTLRDIRRSAGIKVSGCAREARSIRAMAR